MRHIEIEKKWIELKWQWSVLYKEPVNNIDTSFIHKFRKVT